MDCLFSGTLLNYNSIAMGRDMVERVPVRGGRRLKLNQ